MVNLGSNSFEWNFCGAMDLLVIFWNRLYVWVPAIFSSHLLNSLFLLAYWWISKAVCECIVTVHREISMGGCSSLSHLIPFELGLSQERNGCSILSCFLNFIVNFIFVRYVSIEHKWSCIKWSLKCALSRSHGRAILRSILNAHGLHFFSGNRFGRSVLSEKFRVGHGWVIEGDVIIHRAVEVFSISWIS